VEDTKLSTQVSKTKIKDLLGSVARLILSDKDSRNLFFFLLLNLTFGFVELFYGILTNSLGLISDAFHMFFDCSGLVVGLAAKVITKWRANDKFTYGYVRAEILGGFINGLLLLFVSFFIFAESVERLIEPPEVKHDRLFLVSVLGFFVNIIGIFAFQHGGGHGHSHGGGSHGHSHGDHGHSHGDHGHAHNGHAQHGHSRRRRLTHHAGRLPPHLGRHTGVGRCHCVIRPLMYLFGWMIADPICSLFIAVLILVSVLGLLKNSVEILMQRQPRELNDVLPGCFYKISALPGVFSVQEPRCLDAVYWTTPVNNIGRGRTISSSCAVCFMGVGRKCIGSQVSELLVIH
ncbi:Zinc transporter 7-like, partial [Homarus americanus]